MRGQLLVFALFALGASCRGQDAPVEPSEPVEPATAAPELVVPVAEPRQDEGDKAPTPSPSPSPTPSPAAAAAPAGPPPPDNGVTPPPFPLSRYAALWERSPFQLESVAPPVESPALAQRYALTGIAEINGEPLVFVMERATQRRHMLDKKTNSSGLSLVQIDVQQKYTNSTATIREGSDVGVIKFDATTAVAAAPPAIPRPGQPVPIAPAIPGRPPGQPIPGQPGAPAAQPATVPGAVPVPAPVAAAPGVVPVAPVPAAPGAVQAAGPGQENNPPPRVIRRRAVIPSSP